MKTDTRLHKAFERIQLAEEEAKQGFWDKAKESFNKSKEGFKKSMNELRKGIADIKHETFNPDNIEAYEYENNKSDAVVVKYPINKRGWKLCLQILPTDTELKYEGLWTEDRHGNKNIKEILEGLEINPEEYLKELKASSKLILSSKLINLAAESSLIYDANGNVDVSDEALQDWVRQLESLKDLTDEEAQQLLDALKELKKATMTDAQKTVKKVLEDRLENKQKDNKAPKATEAPVQAVQDKKKIEQVGKALMGDNGWKDMIKLIKQAWVG